MQFESFFLKLKHWQVFLIIVGIPIILMSIILFDPELVISLPPYSIFLLTLFIILGMQGWMYSVGSFLYKSMPDHVTKPNFSKFQVLVLITVIKGITEQFMESYLSFEPTPAFSFTSRVVDFSITVSMCVFLGRAIGTVEKGRTVTFSDSVGDFFRFSFIFIGIWTLQPRINHLYNNGDDLEIYDPDRPLDQMPDSRLN